MNSSLSPHLNNLHLHYIKGALKVHFSVQLQPMQGYLRVLFEQYLNFITVLFIRLFLACCQGEAKGGDGKNKAITLNYIVSMIVLP